ncbi:TPA: hypothetical protein QDA94_000299 [Burkholderia vietnamiensis]|uniref:hypothetical protein n=1 Tax=Burkholderia vietnamiensis TaxID=60552 RepID=UPI001BA001B8|nr:hypothetical protein [Burkholderia vietnamiensis]MBR8002408.1 hypothetical protein [Burkholderia vietnamiensis]HDR9046109.1 hypothetical protein [Burkholderia vietnamiensis]HDR9231260.1 hypothetical protein [Burkholderia vietnamiensis]
MHIDFNRVPPRADVLPPPRVSMIAWTALLLLVIAAGAGLTIMLWPTGSLTNGPWFWLGVFVYPTLAWAFLLFAWLAYGYVRRNQAIATNCVSDKAEQECHEAAGRSLEILGHAWYFSADDSENSLEGILTGLERAKPRPSGAVADTDVNARWLNIPDMHFQSGNELAEHARHHAVFTWLLERLIGRVLPQLSALSPGTKLRVELQDQTRLESEVVAARVRELIAARAPLLKVEMESGEHAPSLFRADAWLDNRRGDTARLLIAVNLCDAISTILSDGVAEAGVVLLVGHPCLTSPAIRAELRLHRPAKGAFDAAARTLELATRWGQSSRDRLRTVWVHGLTGDQVGAVRQAAALPTETRWIALETSVGNCSDAGPWLAVALAAESAQTMGEPQMVLCGESDELVALMCRKQT